MKRNRIYSGFISLLILILCGLPCFGTNPLLNEIQGDGAIEVKANRCYIVGGAEDGDQLQVMLVCSDKMFDNKDFDNISEYALKDMAFKIVGEMQYGLDPDFIERILDFLTSDGDIQCNVRVVTIDGFKDGKLTTSGEEKKFAFKVLSDLDIVKAEYFK